MVGDIQNSIIFELQASKYYYIKKKTAQLAKKSDYE